MALARSLSRPIRYVELVPTQYTLGPARLEVDRAVPWYVKNNQYPTAANTPLPNGNTILG